MNRPAKHTKSNVNEGRRANIGLGSFMPAGGGGVEQDPQALADYSSTVDPSVDTYDARNMSFFKPKNGFADFISGGKASDYSNKLNTQSILQDQSQRQALQNRIAEINATHAATLADQEREKSELGTNYINYANANNVPMDAGTSPLSAKGLGSYYMAKYGGGTPFVEGVNKEKTLRNQNTNLDLTDEAQNTPEYGDKYKEHVLDSLQAAVNDALLAGTKSRFELNKFSQNAPADLAASGAESNINLGRARNTLTNLPAENVANLSTLIARPYLNADALVSGGLNSSLGNGYHLLNNATTGFRTKVIKVPSEKEGLAALLPDKNGNINLPKISVSPFDTTPDITATDETGKSKTYKKSSNSAIDSILSPVAALQKAREPFNGVTNGVITQNGDYDDTTLGDETERSSTAPPVSNLSPLLNSSLQTEEEAKQRAVKLMKQNRYFNNR